METLNDSSDNQNAKAKLIVAEIARKTLGISTLETQNSDSLDFHDLSVGRIEQSLLAAFYAGCKSRANGASE